MQSLPRPRKERVCHLKTSLLTPGESRPTADFTRPFPEDGGRGVVKRVKREAGPIGGEARRKPTIGKSWRPRHPHRADRHSEAPGTCSRMPRGFLASRGARGATLAGQGAETSGGLHGLARGSAGQGTAFRGFRHQVGQVSQRYRS